MIKIEPSKFFVYCALIFGILLITLIPPFQSPDEDSHFKRAYVVSRGNFYPTEQNGVAGFYIPEDMTKYISEKLNYIGDREKKYSFSEMILDERLPKDYSNKTFQNFSTAEVTPIAYIAPAIGIVFGKAMNLIMGQNQISVVNMLYFARFFSLLLYIIIVYFAIKTTPILKKTFCLIALIPMSLSLAVCISYDSVLIATCLLATAIIFKLIFDDSVKKINYKYLVALGVIGFILLSIKTIYITVLLPLLFVPKEKYGENWKEIIKKLAIIATIAIAIFIVNKLPTLFMEKAVNDGEQQAISQQISFVMQNPIEYIKIWLKTMFDGRNFYISGLIGTFGLLDTYLANVYVAVYIIALLAVIVSEGSFIEKKVDWKYRVVVIIGALASVFGAFLGMYLFWTSILPGFGVGANSITGVQGRYFLPVIPLLIIVFANSILRKNEKTKGVLAKILENYGIIAIIMLIVSAIAILLRFWC